MPILCGWTYSLNRASPWWTYSGEFNSAAQTNPTFTAPSSAASQDLALQRYLSLPHLWSEHALKRPLRACQREAVASVDLEQWLFARSAKVGVSLVKCCPTFRPQVVPSIGRLTHLGRENPLLRTRYPGRPNRRSTMIWSAR